VDGAPQPGDVVRVCGQDHRFLAWGQFSKADIRIRLLSWDEKDSPGLEFYRRRLTDALHRRQSLFARPGLSAFRLVYGESDGLPGLVADWYDGYIVLSAQTPGADRIKKQAAEILVELTKAKGVVERSRSDVRKLEGLEPSEGLLLGEQPPALHEILEAGHRFLVDLTHGQKTGFYMDQRPNRKLAAEFARDRTVLDVFSYTAAFSVYAASGGAAEITRVESSSDVAALGDKNLELNGLDTGESIVADAFTALRDFRDRGRRFDLIILDPPKLAPTKAQVDRAARAYKDINLLAAKLLNPGGILFTFSCSGGVSADLFQKILFGACLDAGREMRIIHRLSQGSDHPVPLTFPESWYLKGLVIQVD
jgi:23S rRNA (cytosine1962-C5)-methyltransferase